MLTSLEHGLTYPLMILFLVILTHVLWFHMLAALSYGKARFSPSLYLVQRKQNIQLFPLREVITLIQFLENIKPQGLPVNSTTPVIKCRNFEDNMSYINMDNNHKRHPRTSISSSYYIIFVPIVWTHLLPWNKFPQKNKLQTFLQSLFLECNYVNCEMFLCIGDTIINFFTLFLIFNLKGDRTFYHWGSVRIS